jgi:hypothetical protein
LKAKIGDLKSIKLFNRAGANMEAADYDGRTFAHIAACEQIEEILLFTAKSTNFNFSLEDRWGRTPIDEIKDPKFQQIIRQTAKINEGPSRRSSCDEKHESQEGSKSPENKEEKEEVQPKNE